MIWLIDKWWYVGWSWEIVVTVFRHLKKKCGFRKYKIDYVMALHGIKWTIQKPSNTITGSNNFTAYGHQLNVYNKIPRTKWGQCQVANFW